MKQIFFFFMLFSLLFWACNSGEENADEQVPEDVEIEEITTSVNNSAEQKAEPQQVKETKPQLAPDFQQFVAKFPHSSLPYELNPDFEDDAANHFAKIPVEVQVKYLAKPEQLSKADFEEMAEYTDYYFVNSPFQTDKYVAIIYGRFEMGSVYYILCTYDLQGNLIANIDFAAFNMLGAGPQAGQYEITKGKIDENHKVTVTLEDLNGDTTVTNYQIKADGTIKEI